MEEAIEKNMGLVMTIVNKFNPRNPSERDRYVQAGRIGLWKALKKFSPERGTKFSPYAWRPIQWEIIKEIRSNTPKENSICVDPNKDIWVDPSFCQEDLSSFQKLKSEASAAPHKESFWELLPSSLTPDEEKIIYSRLEGYNFKEISNILDANRSHVKKLFNSALKKIRDNNE